MKLQSCAAFCFMSVLKNRALDILIIVFGFNSSTTAVYWTQQPEIIQFGNNATLTCMVNETDKCDNKTTRRWDSGCDNKLLLFNGRSSNRKKYIELTDNPCHSFSLVILSFGRNDVNCEYTCYFGFETCKLMLNLSEHNFIKEPSWQSIDFNGHGLNRLKTETKIEMIFHQVYPIPTCTITIGVNITSDERLVLKENEVSVEYPGGLFYNVTLQTESNIKCDKGHNNVTLLVHCTLLSFAFLQMHKTLNCTEQILDADKTPETILLIVGTLLFTFGIFGIGKQCLKKLSNSPRNTHENKTDSRLTLGTEDDANEMLSTKSQNRKNKDRKTSGTLL